jgi:ABC-type glutathione transport system ATPase component
MAMIQTEGLTRHFRVKKELVEAVRGVDMTVEAGEVVALLGPNGAGKSTTLRMPTTLLPPTAGRATVAGCDVARDPAGVRRRIGYIGQGNGAGHAQLVRDELLTQGRCYGLSRAESRRRADELLARWTWSRWRGAGSARSRAASAGASTSPSASSTGPRCSSSTSPPPGSTPRTGPISGPTSPGSARSTAPPSCSPPTTSTRPTASPSGC